MINNNFSSSDEYSDFSLGGWTDTAGNIVSGDNPVYTIDNFISFYPQFGPSSDTGEWPIPQDILQIYINLASASVAYNRWLDAWYVGMGLFVAHWATLYLQSLLPSGSSAKEIAGAGLNKGILVAKSVGDVSASYTIIAGIEDWGAFNLTVYGQQFASIGNTIGMGGMYIW